VGFTIHLPQGSAAQHSGRTFGRVDMNIFHAGQVDHKTPVAERTAADVVSATADGYEQLVFAREVDRGNNVRHP